MYDAAVSGTAVPSFVLQVYEHPRGVPMLFDTAVCSLVWRLSRVYDAVVSGTAVPSHSLQMYMQPLARVARCQEILFTPSLGG